MSKASLEYLNAVPQVIKADASQVPVLKDTTDRILDVMNAVIKTGWEKANGADVELVSLDLNRLA